jgi:hypothetical protein
MKHRTHPMEGNAYPGPPPFTDLCATRTKQALDIGPRYIGSNRILENGSRFYDVLIAFGLYSLPTRPIRRGLLRVGCNTSCSCPITPHQRNRDL